MAVWVSHDKGSLTTCRLFAYKEQRS